MSDKFTSKPEIELATILSQVTTFIKTRKIINPYEIDLYSPEYRVGIEYNGVHWHSSEFQSMFYHQEKCLMALSNNVKLYHIFDYEWTSDDNKIIILSQIKRLMGLCPLRIEAFKCKQIEPSRTSCNEFLSRNCLKYNENYDYALGLEYEGRLISVCTFLRKEIINYAEQMDTYIHKGISHLLVDKHDISISIDLGKFIYPFLSEGFRVVNVLDPEVHWFYIDHVATSEELSLLMKNKPINDQYLRELGCMKFYDCGNLLMTKI